MRLNLLCAKNMRVNQGFIGLKGVAMVDIKKALRDLSDSIRYADMYDLTEVPKILEEASDKIEKLEIDIIKLLARLEESRMNRDNLVINYKPPSERARIKSELEDLGIEYSTKDNTQRLFRKLQRAQRG